MADRSLRQAAVDHNSKRRRSRTTCVRIRLAVDAERNRMHTEHAFRSSLTEAGSE